MRVRNLIVLLGMGITVFALVRFAEWEMGAAMMLAGGAATVLVLGWNFVWVNTVLFHQTKREVEQSTA